MRNQELWSKLDSGGEREHLWGAMGRAAGDVSFGQSAATLVRRATCERAEVVPQSQTGSDINCLMGGRRKLQDGIEVGLQSSNPG